MDIINPYIHGGEALAFDGFGNRSRSLDGSSDYISIPDINESTTNLSVALWVKTTDVDWVTTHFAHWRNQDNNRAWWIGPSRTLETNGKKLMVYLSGGGAGNATIKRYYGTTDVSDGTWHHVAFTWDNGTLKLFVDGSEETTTKVANDAMTSIYNSNGPITVGCTWVNDAPLNFGSGGRADVRIYNSTLTATDISDLYNGTNITTNLAGHWLTDADNVLDAAGTNHGTNYGTKYSYDNPSPPVEFGSASRSFDGASDRIEIADTNDHSFGDGVNDSPFSVSAWIKIEATSKQFRILSKWSNDIGAEWTFSTDAQDRLSLFLKDASTNALIKRYYSTSLSIYLNQWVYVSATYDGRGGSNAGDGIDLYLNGVNVDDSNGNSNVYAAMENKNSLTFIGSLRLATNSFQSAEGKIADVRLYDAELSSSDITSLYNGTDVQTNLIGHWLTDNDDVEDKAGTNDGTNFGSVYSIDNPPLSLVPSRQASRNFDGVDDRVIISKDSINGATVLTVSAWIKMDTLGLNQTVIGILPLINTNAFRLMVRDTNQIDLIWGDGSNFFVSTLDGVVLTSGSWIHVAGTFNNSGNAIRYVNGAQTGTIDDMSSYGALNLTYDIGIGARYQPSSPNYNLPLDGKIADVRIYDAELTASQILDIYNGTTDRTNLIGQWLTNSDDVEDKAGTNDGTNNGSTYSTDSPL